MMLGLYTINPMAPRAATLLSLPPDVLVEIFRVLNVHDILVLRRTSRYLNIMTRQRPVWQNALNHACAQHGLPRFLPLLQAQSDQEIEHYACRPAKFQVVLDHFAASTTAPRRPRNEFDLPQDDYAQLHLVTGGKWLVTLTTEGALKVWDLEPYHHIAARPSGSKASGYGIDKPPPMLCGEGRFAARSTLMDARLSDDSAQLLTFLHHPRNDYGEELSDVSVSFLDIRGASTWSPTHVPIAVQRGSIWSHREWSFGPNTTASFAGPWAVFTHKVWPTGATPGTWVWNWKRNISKRVNLQVSSEVDGLFRTKIIADYLITAHKMGRKLSMSVYPLTAVQWDNDLASYSSQPATRLNSPSASTSTPTRDPTPMEGLEYASHELPPPHTNTSSPPYPDVLAPLFTSKFHGLHHVEQYHARGERPANSSSTQGFVHRRGGHNVPFNVATVSISDPFWLTPPRPRHRDHGSFRVGIAVESKGEAAFRTRLQYYIRLDLNDLVAAYPVSSLPIVTAPWLGSNGGTDVGIPSELGLDGAVGSGKQGMKPPYPRLRGRVSNAREGMYFHDRLFVFAGRKKIVSLWSATDGIHAHSSPLFKVEETGKKAASPVSPRAQSSSRAFSSSTTLSPTSSTRPRLTFRHRTGGSSRSVPLATSHQTERSGLDANAESFAPMGDDLVIFTWPQPKSRKGKARAQQAEAQRSSSGAGSKSPSPSSDILLDDDLTELSMPLPNFGFGAGDYKEFAIAMDNPPDPNMDGRRRDTLGNRLAMMGDVFSGRIVVLDELEAEFGVGPRRTIIRVLDYV